MASVNIVVTNIGQVIQFQTGTPVVGLIALSSFVDTIENQTATRFFKKQFRYSTNGVIYSDWIDLTNANLIAISVSSVDTFYIQYLYTRAGIDATGTLTWDNITLNGTTVALPSGSSYSNSIFAPYFDRLDTSVLNWAINVLDKLYKPGIVPNYIIRTGNQSEDLDYIKFWKPICIFFSYLVQFARVFETFNTNSYLANQYLLQRGMFTSGEESLDELLLIIQNMLRMRGERGTSRMYFKDDGDSDSASGSDEVNPFPNIDGELLRLLEGRGGVLVQGDYDKIFDEKFTSSLDIFSSVSSGVATWIWDDEGAPNRGAFIDLFSGGTSEKLQTSVNVKSGNKYRGTITYINDPFILFFNPIIFNVYLGSTLILTINVADFAVQHSSSFEITAASNETTLSIVAVSVASNAFISEILFSESQLVGASNFFQLALPLSKYTGWNIGNISPGYRGSTGRIEMNLAYEDSAQVNKISPYPLLNSSFCSVFNEPGKSVFKITNVTAGKISGIGARDLSKTITVDPHLNFEITFFVKQVNLANVLTFGVIALDANNNVINLKDIVSGSSSNYFFQRKSLLRNDKYYFVRGIIFNQDHFLVSSAKGQLNIGFGTNLKFPSNVAKIIPYITLDNSLGGGASGTMYFWDIKTTPILPYSRGFLNNKNFIDVLLKNNNATYDNNDIYNIMRKFFIPYNTSFKNTYLEGHVDNGDSQSDSLGDESESGSDSFFHPVNYMIEPSSWMDTGSSPFTSRSTTTFTINPTNKTIDYKATMPVIMFAGTVPLPIHIVANTSAFFGDSQMQVVLSYPGSTWTASCHGGTHDVDAVIPLNANVSLLQIEVSSLVDGAIITVTVTVGAALNT